MSEMIPRYEARTGGWGNDYALNQEDGGPFCLCTDVAALEAKLAAAEKQIAEFCMDYRMKCDEQTKALHNRLAAAEEELDKRTCEGIELGIHADRATNIIDALSAKLAAAERQLATYEGVNVWEELTAAEKERDALRKVVDGYRIPSTGCFCYMSENSHLGSVHTSECREITKALAPTADSEEAE